MAKIEPVLLSDTELQNIARAEGRKLELNYQIFIRQLLGHIAALTGAKSAKGETSEDETASA